MYVQLRQAHALSQLHKLPPDRVEDLAEVHVYRVQVVVAEANDVKQLVEDVVPDHVDEFVILQQLPLAADEAIEDLLHGEDVCLLASPVEARQLARELLELWHHGVLPHINR